MKKLSFLFLMLLAAPAWAQSPPSATWALTTEIAVGPTSVAYNLHTGGALAFKAHFGIHQLVGRFRFGREYLAFGNEPDDFLAAELGYRWQALGGDRWSIGLTPALGWLQHNDFAYVTREQPGSGGSSYGVYEPRTRHYLTGHLGADATLHLFPSRRGELGLRYAFGYGSNLPLQQLEVFFAVPLGKEDR